MTASSDPRGAALHALDAQSSAFRLESARRLELGAASAARDVDQLIAIAERLAADVRVWDAMLRRSSVALETPLDLARAGALVVECVFDEVLEPAATRVLVAALDLVGSRP
jgi:hypothetical protein